MRKIVKFAIISLVAVICVVAALFFVKHNVYKVMFYREVKLTKKFWSIIIQENSRPEDIKPYLPQKALSNLNSEFYSFKIWFADHGPVIPSIKLLKSFGAGYLYKTDNRHTVKTKDVAVAFRYNGAVQLLQAAVIEEGGVLKLFPSLSLNDCSWNPDYNNDGVIDREDLLMAKKRDIRSRPPWDSKIRPPYRN